MRGDGFAHDGTDTGDEVEHTVGQAHLVDDLGEDERVDRCHFARLEHDGVAGRERRSDLQGDLMQRVVPGRDAADDADRLAHDQRVADLALELVRAQHLCSDGEVGLRQTGLDGLAEPSGMPTSWAIVWAISSVRASSPAWIFIR